LNRDKTIIKNAHANNLKNIDIEIPEEKITCNRNFEGIACKLEKAVITRVDDEAVEED
jgi:hypothetical protein